VCGKVANVRIEADCTPVVVVALCNVGESQVEGISSQDTLIVKALHRHPSLSNVIFPFITPRSPSVGGSVEVASVVEVCEPTEESVFQSASLGPVTRSPSM
jgi:hypothetical protein